MWRLGECKVTRSDAKWREAIWSDAKSGDRFEMALGKWCGSAISFSLVCRDKMIMHTSSVDPKISRLSTTIRPRQKAATVSRITSHHVASRRITLHHFASLNITSHHFTLHSLHIALPKLQLELSSNDSLFNVMRETTNYWTWNCAWCSDEFSSSQTVRLHLDIRI